MRHWSNNYSHRVCLHVVHHKTCKLQQERETATESQQTTAGGTATAAEWHNVYATK